VRAVLFGGLAVSLMAWPEAHSQEPPRPVFRGGVELVQVDVVVIDNETGLPVRGLKPEDFTILDQKRPQKVATFYEAHHEHPRDEAVFPLDLPMDVADNSLAQASRVVVIVVDDLHIVPRETEPIRALVRQIVADLGPKASIGLVLTSGNRGGVEVSDDRAEIFRAIDKFAAQRRDPRLGGGGFGDGGFWDDQALFKTLADVAKMLGVEVERRKAFILISPGLPIDLAGMFDTMQMRPTRISDSGAIVASRAIFDDLALLDMMDAMRRANVATYAISTRAAMTPIDPGVLIDDSITRAGPPGREPGTLTAGLLWDQPAFRARDFLSEIARGSGGFALVNRAGFADGLVRLLDDLDHYYMLGFYPDDAGKKWRNLDVQVNRPDVTLRFRRGYQLGVATKPPKNKDPMVGFSASVLPKTDLPLKMFATVLPSRGKTPRLAVTLQVRVPRVAMADADGVLRDVLKITSLAVDPEKRKVVKGIARERRVSLKPAADAPQEAELTYQIASEWDLPPGRYQLRTSAHSAKLNKGGSVYLTVDVPDFSKSPVTLTGLVVGYADSERPAVAMTSIERAILPFEPVLDRVFTPQDTLRISYAVWRRSLGDAAATRIELVDERFTKIRSIEQQVAAMSPGMVDVSLPLTDLRPGAYRIRVAASVGAAETNREIGFLIGPTSGSVLRFP
jgi:VWFA-related protein